MAHYALLDENNIVTQVITGKDETDQRDGVDVNWEEWYKDFHSAIDCKRPVSYTHLTLPTIYSV